MSTETILVTLNKIPRGIPSENDFKITESKIRDPEDGEFLAETIFLAIDPYIRVTMVGRHFFSTPKEGEVPRGSTISRVIKSKNDHFQEGDLVVMESGMQSHAVSNGIDSCLNIENGLNLTLWRKSRLKQIVIEKKEILEKNNFYGSLEIKERKERSKNENSLRKKWLKN